MKNLFVVFFCLFALSFSLEAQNDGFYIGTDQGEVNKNALLDINSNSKGVLIPRMSTSQRLLIFENSSFSDKISSKSLLVFDTDLSSFVFWNGVGWKETAAAGNIIPDLLDSNDKIFEKHIPDWLLNKGLRFINVDSDPVGRRGDLIYNTSENCFKCFDGTFWKKLSAETITQASVTSVNGMKGDVSLDVTDFIRSASSNPISGIDGDLFVNTSDNKLYRRDGINWISLSADIPAKLNSVLFYTGSDSPVDMMFNVSGFEPSKNIDKLLLKTSTNELFAVKSNYWSLINSNATSATIRANWNEADPTSISFIDNKPFVPAAFDSDPLPARKSDLIYNSTDKCFKSYSGSDWNSIEITPSDYSILKTDIISLKAKATTLDTEITGLKAKDTSLDTEITGLKAKDTSLDTEITGLKAKDTSLDTEITGLKAKDTSLDTEITGLKAKGTSLDTEITDLKAKDTSLDTDIAGLKAKDTVLDTDIDGLKAKDTALDTDIDGLNAKDASLDTDIAELKAKDIAMNLELESTRADLEILRRRIDQVESSITGVGIEEITELNYVAKCSEFAICVSQLWAVVKKVYVNIGTSETTRVINLELEYFPSAVLRDISIMKQFHQGFPISSPGVTSISKYDMPKCIQTLTSSRDVLHLMIDYWNDTFSIKLTKIK